MANRFQVNQHKLAYSFIASRDGDYCLICKSGPDKVQLQIDHADNNPSNWVPDNLHLLCQEHNLQFRGVPVAEKLRIIEEHSANNEREREKRYGSIRGKVAKDTIDYKSGSPEMKANSMFEPVFTEWLMKNLPMTKEEAINSGALVAGCSPLTTGRYLKKLTCAAGPLKEFRDGMNVPAIDFKEDHQRLPDDYPNSDKSHDRVSIEEKGSNNSDPVEAVCAASSIVEAVIQRRGYQFRPPQSEIRNYDVV